MFPGGSLGFASPAELREYEPVTAVCLPPGARLVLEQMPGRLQEELGIGEMELVTFTQLGYEPFTYRDAVRFLDGREILIQRLQENQRAIVLSLGDDGDGTGRGLSGNLTIGRNYIHV